MVCGDCNIGFFHAKAFNRFQRNSIHGYCDETSAWQDDDKVLERIVVDYFHSIFRTNGQSETVDVITTVQPVVSMSMNEALTMEFQAEEVAKALKQMHLKKALGPDGMPPLFYQRYWSLVGNYVTKIVLDFLNQGISPPGFYDIHIILIPKVKNLTKITHYHPISLSNVVSRLASKVLANMSKVLFPHIISENQSAFYV